MKAKCPYADCGNESDVPVTYVGRRVSCPACQRVFVASGSPGKEGAVPCGLCGEIYRSPPRTTGIYLCPSCRRKAARIVMRGDSGQAASGIGPPTSNEPLDCPVCAHKVKGPKCMYCGADLSLSADQAMMASVDAAKGVLITLWNEAGKQVLSGTLRVRPDGLQIWGYDPGSQGSAGAGDAAGGFAANVALSLAIFAISGGSVIAVPIPGGAQGQADEPSSIYVVLPWAKIASIEDRGDRIRITAHKEVKKLFKTVTEMESFEIVLTTLPKGQEKRYRSLCEQILKYKADPSALPCCPTCRHVIKADARSCMYCGATW